jgi:hypothetical protein
MAVEVHKATGFWNDQSTDWSWHALLELAKAISASAHWQIIDSYALGASPARVKGDPIGGGTWGGLVQGDAASAAANAWFIAEQITTSGGRPAMQVKFQCAGNDTYADASGAAAGYRWEGQSNFRSIAARFSPVGGWVTDDVDPDFADPTKAGDNNRFSMSHDGSGNDGRWRFIMDEEYLLIITYNVTSTYWFSVPLYVAEYNPKSAGQDTIAAPAYLMMCANETTRVGPSGATASKFLRMTFTDTNQLVGCLDENGVFQEWGWMVPATGDGGGEFFAPETQPNEWDSTLGLDFLEVIITGQDTIAGPDKRIIGSLRHIWQTYGLGDAGFVDSKQYLTLGRNALCVVIEWDGASTI